MKKKIVALFAVILATFVLTFGSTVVSNAAASPTASVYPTRKGGTIPSPIFDNVDPTDVSALLDGVDGFVDQVVGDGGLLDGIGQFVTDIYGHYVTGKDGHYVTDKNGNYVTDKNGNRVTTDRSDKSPDTAANENMGVIVGAMGICALSAAAVLHSKKKVTE